MPEKVINAVTGVKIEPRKSKTGLVPDTVINAVTKGKVENKKAPRKSLTVRN